ncbi:MAG: hypothetical protein KME11_15615 [Timaviella obliquedivisa GSE-PSE-MK23-08B]|jgi:hypothetical protein|nr:hypothetical protein [Timaviella obliquedivisa GSE-PSE-MK23-08B]
MSVTVGTTLQNDKFVIKAILHQTDFGVTYQAAHPFLNHPIILQSFNEALRHRSDFEQLRQQFLQEVLIFSKQPSEAVQIIDCFEENGMPFVVLEAAAGHSIPPLSSWLEIPVEAPAIETAQPTTEASALKAALATAFPEAPLEAPPEAPPKATVVVTPIAPAPAPKETEAIAIAQAKEIAPVPAEAVITSPALQSFPLPDYATNGSRKEVNVLVSEQSSKPRKWMPLSLMMTALITGFGGVGLGLALRFQPTSQEDSSSSLGSGWFGREQSFPPQQEWPITETPNLYSPSSAFEQPYQASPSLRESGIPFRQPSTGYTPPAQIAPPDYQPAPPGIADYPPTIPDPVLPPPAFIADPAAPETTQPVIPLPQPVIPEVPLEDPLETSPEISKPLSSSQIAPAEAPIFRQ